MHGTALAGQNQSILLMPRRETGTDDMVATLSAKIVMFLSTTVSVTLGSFVNAALLYMAKVGVGES